MHSAGKNRSLSSACTGQVLSWHRPVEEGRVPKVEKSSLCERVSVSASLVCWWGVDSGSGRVRW